MFMNGACYLVAFTGDDGSERPGYLGAVCGELSNVSIRILSLELVRFFFFFVLFLCFVFASEHKLHLLSFWKLNEGGELWDINI